MVIMKPWFAADRFFHGSRLQDYQESEENFFKIVFLTVLHKVPNKKSMLFSKNFFRKFSFLLKT